MTKDIRWLQRFEHFEKAVLFLQRSSQLGHYDELQQAGLIQSFEFTFELGWKTIKDYLNLKGYEVKTPRDSLKLGFQIGLLEEGHIWIEMLDKRNELTHVYSQEEADRAIFLIRDRYLEPIEKLYIQLKEISRLCQD